MDAKKGYEPTQEERRRAEETMTPEQKEMIMWREQVRDAQHQREESFKTLTTVLGVAIERSAPFFESWKRLEDTINRNMSDGKTTFKNVGDDVLTKLEVEPVMRLYQTYIMRRGPPPPLNDSKKDELYNWMEAWTKRVNTQLSAVVSKG